MTLILFVIPALLLPVTTRAAAGSSPASGSSAVGGSITTGHGLVGTEGSRVTIRNNWPCTGCVVVVPSTYNPRVPSAILVALHGDEGESSLIASTWAPATERMNVILFAPQCPTSKGCRLANGSAGYTNSWWGWLQYSGHYDDAWIGQQVKKVARAYSLDPGREYLTGWSGGADFLGWYALRHASTFAAVAFVAGGVPYDTACSTTPIAGYFLMGSADFRYDSGQPSEVRAVLAHCGDPTKLVVLAGADHSTTSLAVSTRGYGQKILRWMLAHARAG